MRGSLDISKQPISPTTRLGASFAPPRPISPVLNPSESTSSILNWTRKINLPADYIFSVEDSPENIVMEDELIRGATVTKFVERLTAIDYAGINILLVLQKPT
jgi:hypothetical protein